MNGTMGEVKIKIKIINATDEGMFRRGELSAHLVRSEETLAVLDAGATTSVVTPEIAQRLGLAVLRQERAVYANNYSEEIDIGEPIIFEFDGRRCAEEPFIMGDEVLIGQIPLERMDLVVDCIRQQVVPNPKHPDRPTFRV